jgi:hypothetical protein
MADESSEAIRQHLQPLPHEPVPPRSTAEYQPLCEEVSNHEQANETHRTRTNDQRHSDPDESNGCA